MINYSHEVEKMCCVKKGPHHGPAPIPEEGNWVKAYEIKDISGFSHGIGWCAPQQGTCKLTLNIKEGIVEEALVETLGCSGMTHSAAMAAEILPGKTLLECLNTDLVCDAINTAMREIFLQLVYGRSQSDSQKTVLLLVQVLKTLVKDFVHRLVQCSQQKLRAFVIWKWQRATLQEWLLTLMTRLSVMNSLNLAR